MPIAIILAGGLGTRLRSAVPDLPKPMAPVRGIPFLAYQIDYWINQGIDRFVLSVGYKHEEIQKYFGLQYKGVPIDYSIELTPLGTGGGLLNAVKLCQDQSEFLLLNGDTYFEVDLSRLQECAKINEADWVFSVFRSQGLGRYMAMGLGVDGEILEVHNVANKLGSFVNGGVYWVKTKSIDSILNSKVLPLSLEQDLFPLFIEEHKKLFALESTGQFIDIGIPDDFIRAASILPVMTGGSGYDYQT